MRGPAPAADQAGRADLDLRGERRHGVAVDESQDLADGIAGGGEHGRYRAWLGRTARVVPPYRVVGHGRTLGEGRAVGGVRGGWARGEVGPGGDARRAGGEVGCGLAISAMQVEAVQAGAA